MRTQPIQIQIVVAVMSFIATIVACWQTFADNETVASCLASSSPEPLFFAIFIAPENAFEAVWFVTSIFPVSSVIWNYCRS